MQFSNYNGEESSFIPSNSMEFSHATPSNTGSIKDGPYPKPLLDF
jgi:hypothetical protein